MLFNVEYDHGSVIEGYLIPDGFSGDSHISVSDDSGDLGTFACDQMRPAVAQVGRHETGRVGFRLDEMNVPSLTERSTLVIRDLESGLMIYRRTGGRHCVPLKVFRLETQLLPLKLFDRKAGENFQYEATSIERYGHETTLQVFLLHEINSIYVSGRLLLRNYENYFDKGFKGIIFLSDPYYEMATRLLIFKRMASTPNSLLGERDKLILAPAIEYFANCSLEDARSLRTLLKKAPLKVANVLASPVTRQFTCSSPDQRVNRSEVAAAIDVLSRFAIVGHHTDLPSFQDAVGEFIGIEADDLVIPPRQMLIEEIAGALKSIPSAEVLLEEDLIFDYYVRQALISADREDTSKDLERNAAPSNR